MLTAITAAKTSGCAQAARPKIAASRHARCRAAAAIGEARAARVCSFVTSIRLIWRSPNALLRAGGSTSSGLTTAPTVACIERATCFRNVRIRASVSMIVIGSASSMPTRIETIPTPSASVLLSWLTMNA